MLATATTWGITAPQFVAGYALLCAVAAIVARRRWKQAFGTAEGRRDPLPGLGLYSLAMLGGGPQLAITTAAAQLHHEGRLMVDPADGALHAGGELDAAADPLERAVFETIRAEPGITARALRARLADCEALRELAARLTEAGLLVAEQRASALRRMWIPGALLTGLGIWRIVAEDDPGLTVVAVAVAALASVWIARVRPLATERGEMIVARSRGEREDLRTHPTARDGALTAALFGGPALWVAAPELASALEVPREPPRTTGWGGGGGAGCGGAAWDSSASSCSGGGCGGGGCGGGGG